MRAMILLTLALSLATCPNRALGEDSPSLDSIRWVLGDWTREKEKTANREKWKDIGGGVFRGIGSVVGRENGKVRSQESLLLVEMSGEIFYLAKVKQNPRPIAFKLTDFSNTHAIFENPDHDFPKRLEYRLREPGMMDVKVTGADGGFVIPFRKMKADDE
ncbi:MAG: DUF6265 family protein [Planctomycetota bacterium]